MDFSILYHNDIYIYTKQQLLIIGMETGKHHQIFYRITPHQSTIDFEQIFGKYMYENTSGGFIRKAISNKNKSVLQKVEFIDSQFKIQQTNDIRVVRLYDLYLKQKLLFPEDQSSSSFIDTQMQYNSFLAESGMISFDYLRTLFITQSVNKKGCYEYFVKRNGQYYYQYCDDTIPVNKLKKPLWNLGLEHPWQLVLFKAWLKQCKSLDNLRKAKPFQLLDAFGLPQYRCFNFRKELFFLKNQKIESNKKQQNINCLAMNKNDVVIIGKTIDDPRVEKVGLIPNFAAYRTLRVHTHNQEGLYRVFSSLPCHWTGSYSPIFKNQLTEIYQEDMFLDLERNFLMTEKELVTYFNKFYVVPFDICDIQRLVTQDCLHIPQAEQEDKVQWVCFQVKSQQGMLAISIQLPKSSKEGNKYPQFRYFLTKNNNEQQISKSHFRPDIRAGEREGNMYIESNCDKWEYYNIDYVQSYHHNSSFFCKVVPGFYVLYIDVQYDGPINVRFDSFVQITRPQIYRPSQSQIKQIFDSTFFSVSMDMGVQASLSNNFEQSISLNNAFEETGFGSITIKTLTKAKHRIAMRIFPQKLRKAGYRLLEHYTAYQELDKQKNLVFISSKGRPEIFVMEKIQNRHENTIGTIFPPPQAVQFFKLTPQLVLNYNQN